MRKFQNIYIIKLDITSYFFQEWDDSDTNFWNTNIFKLKKM
mgnify:CR=1 FL=1